MSEMLMYLGVTCAVKHVIYFLWRDRLPRDAELAGHVTQLHLYPVKSIREITLDQITCTAGLGPHQGPIIDRQFMLYDQKTLQLISVRQHYKLILVQPRYDGQLLTLTAPDHDQVTLQMETVVRGGRNINVSCHGEPVRGLDCGDEVATWLATFLGDNEARLLFAPPATGRRNFQFIFNEPFGRWTKHANPDDKMFYQDATPFNLLSEQSMKDVSEHVGREISPMQFRPNIVVSADRGAFDEDSWQEVFIGKTRFRTVILSPRCVLPTIDRATGIRNKDNEPLKTLKRYRCIVPGQDPVLSSNLVVERPGTIRVGDAIYVVRGYDMNSVQ